MRVTDDEYEMLVRGREELLHRGLSALDKLRIERKEAPRSISEVKNLKYFSLGTTAGLGALALTRRLHTQDKM